MVKNMKKHLAVFMLIIRYSFYKILGLLAAMTVIETGLFWFALRKGGSQDGFGLEYVIEKSHIAIVFWIMFVILDVILISFVGYEKQETHRYTLMRLSVTRKEIYFLQSSYNILCYVMFWAVQAFIVIFFSFLYVQNAPAEWVTEQTVFLAFYRSQFMHALLPLEDFPYWIQNVLMCIVLGFTSADYLKEEGKIRKSRGITWGIIYVSFYGRLGVYVPCILFSIFCIGCIIYVIYQVNREEAESRMEERLVESCEN